MKLDIRNYPLWEREVQGFVNLDQELLSRSDAEKNHRLFKGIIPSRISAIQNFFGIKESLGGHNFFARFDREIFPALDSGELSGIERVMLLDGWRDLVEVLGKV